MEKTFYLSCLVLFDAMLESAIKLGNWEMAEEVRKSVKYYQSLLA
jgi:hypothetical protein